MGPVSAAAIPVLGGDRGTVGFVTTGGRSLLGVVPGTLDFVAAVGRMSHAGNVSPSKKSGKTKGDISLGTLIS